MKLYFLFVVFRIAHAESKTIISKINVMSNGYKKPSHKWHHKKIKQYIQKNYIPEIPNTLLQAIITVGTYTV